MRAYSALLLDLGGVITEPQDPARLDAMAAILLGPSGSDPARRGELERGPGARGLSDRSVSPEGMPLREAFRAAYLAPRRDFDRGAIDEAEYWGRVLGAFIARIGEPAAGSAGSVQPAGSGNLASSAGSARLASPAGPGGPAEVPAGSASTPRADSPRAEAASTASLPSPVRGGLEALIPRLRAEDIGGWFSIRPGMLSLLDEVKRRGLRLGLLSNLNKPCAAHLDAEHPWLDRFDAKVYSCDEGLLKPERAIYELCASRLGLPPSACLFVDDLEENAQGAREAGLGALRFEDEASLRRELAGLGLLG